MSKIKKYAVWLAVAVLPVLAFMGLLPFWFAHFGADAVSAVNLFLDLLRVLMAPTIVIGAIVVWMVIRFEAEIRSVIPRINELNTPLGKLGFSQDSAKMGKAKIAMPTPAGLPEPVPTGPNLARIREKAEAGDMEAQFQLGLAYYFGNGVDANKKEAAKWWRLAARQEHVKAQFNLGMLYDHGEGVEQDKAKAAAWYQSAAAQHAAQAQFNLGLMYHHGEGVEQDYAKAAKWWQLAARQEHAKAQFNLGVSYNKGEGVPQDDTQAVKWYQRAARQGYTKAQVNLGVAYAKGEGAPQCYREAYIWFSLAIASGCADAAKGRDFAAKRLSAADLADARQEAVRRHDKFPPQAG